MPNAPLTACGAFVYRGNMQGRPSTLPLSPFQAAFAPPPPRKEHARVIAPAPAYPQFDVDTARQTLLDIWLRICGITGLSMVPPEFHFDDFDKRRPIAVEINGDRRIIFFNLRGIGGHDRVYVAKEFIRAVVRVWNASRGVVDTRYVQRFHYHNTNFRDGVHAMRAECRRGGAQGYSVIELGPHYKWLPGALFGIKWPKPSDIPKKTDSGVRTLYCNCGYHVRTTPAVAALQIINCTRCNSLFLEPKR